MIVAVNVVQEYEGHQYHVQAEDLGEKERAFTVRVYEGGTVKWTKRFPYDELLAEGLDRQDFDVKLRVLMEKTAHTVQAAIAKGKLG